MVQFPRCGFRTLYIQIRMADSRLPGYPIRLPADHGMCAPPRRFSQLAAAFFARTRQGIHLWTLFSLDHIVVPPDSAPLRIRLSPFSVSGFPAAFLSNICFLGQDRVELSTPALSEQCSNRLSY